MKCRLNIIGSVDCTHCAMCMADVREFKKRKEKDNMINSYCAECGHSTLCRHINKMNFCNTPFTVECPYKIPIIKIVLHYNVETGHIESDSGADINEIRLDTGEIFSRSFLKTIKEPFRRITKRGELIEITVVKKGEKEMPKCHKCAYCGANIDFGEHCDCEKEESFIITFEKGNLLKDKSTLTISKRKENGDLKILNSFYGSDADYWRENILEGLIYYGKGEEK